MAYDGKDARTCTDIGESVKLGVIQLNPQKELRERFFHVVNDLREAACIVDVWMMDLQTIFREHGYELTLKRVK